MKMSYETRKKTEAALRELPEVLEKNKVTSMMPLLLTMGITRSQTLRAMREMSVISKDTGSHYKWRAGEVTPELIDAICDFSDRLKEQVDEERRRKEFEADKNQEVLSFENLDQDDDTPSMVIATDKYLSSIDNPNVYFWHNEGGGITLAHKDTETGLLADVITLPIGGLERIAEELKKG